MAVTIRLARHGQKKRPFYRVVAADKQRWRDGKFLEVLGTYNPMVNPPTIALKEEKIRKWLGQGAQTSLLVQNLIKKQFPGLLESRVESKKKKIQEARKKRKARASGKQPEKKKTEKKVASKKAPAKKTVK